MQPRLVQQGDGLGERRLRRAVALRRVALRAAQRLLPDGRRQAQQELEHRRRRRPRHQARALRRRLRLARRLRRRARRARRAPSVGGARQPHLLLPVLARRAQRQHRRVAQRAERAQPLGAGRLADQLAEERLEGGAAAAAARGGGREQQHVESRLPLPVGRLPRGALERGEQQRRAGGARAVAQLADGQGRRRALARLEQLSEALRLAHGREQRVVRHAEGRERGVRREPLPQRRLEQRAARGQPLRDEALAHRDHHARHLLRRLVARLGQLLGQRLRRAQCRAELRGRRGALAPVLAQRRLHLRQLRRVERAPCAARRAAGGGGRLRVAEADQPLASTLR